MLVLAQGRPNAQAIFVVPSRRAQALNLPPSSDRNLSRPTQDGNAFAVADRGSVADAWLPSLRRRRGDLPAWSRANSEPGALPCRSGIFPVACQHDAVSE